MPDIQTHRRITEILFNYWNEVRGERLFPSRNDIEQPIGVGGFS